MLVSTCYTGVIFTTSWSGQMAAAVAAPMVGRKVRLLPLGSGIDNSNRFACPRAVTIYYRFWPVTATDTTRDRR